jgi:hypothetical protein
VILTEEEWSLCCLGRNQTFFPTTPDLFLPFHLNTSAINSVFFSSSFSAVYFNDFLTVQKCLYPECSALTMEDYEYHPVVFIVTFFSNQDFLVRCSFR